MKNRRTHANQGGAGEQHPVTWRKCQEYEACQGTAHPDGQGIGFGMVIGIEPNQRLQQGCRNLVSQGDQADLCEAEAEDTLQQRVDRRDQGLEHIVQKMRKTDGPQNLEASRFCGSTWCGERFLAGCH